MSRISESLLLKNLARVMSGKKNAYAARLLGWMGMDRECVEGQEASAVFKSTAHLDPLLSTGLGNWVLKCWLCPLKCRLCSLQRRLSEQTSKMNTKESKIPPEMPPVRALNMTERFTTRGTDQELWQGIWKPIKDRPEGTHRFLQNPAQKQLCDSPDKGNREMLGEIRQIIRSRASHNERLFEFF